MTQKSFRQAISEALAGEMRRDPTVVLIGEDISGGKGTEGEDDAWGGPWGTSKGFLSEFGPDRVLDAPITESAFIGAAAAAAATGLRPVAELMFVDFMGVCFDQIYNQAAKFRYMFGGKAKTPLVITTTYGTGFAAAGHHSQSLYPIFTHIPGLKVAIPSSAYEAKGLLIEAIRDDDPVVFFQHKAMFDDEEEVPDEAYTLPFGEANITREGDDVTVVAIGRMVQVANQVADKLEADDIGCTVVDPRTTSPMDLDTIVECVEETGRLVVVDEASPRCNMATDISAQVSRDAFKALKAPIQMVSPPHVPVPFAPVLEKAYTPDAEKPRSGGTRGRGLRDVSTFGGLTRPRASSPATRRRARRCGRTDSPRTSSRRSDRRRPALLADNRRCRHRPAPCASTASARAARAGPGSRTPVEPGP